MGFESVNIVKNRKALFNLFESKNTFIPRNIFKITESSGSHLKGRIHVGAYLSFDIYYIFSMNDAIGNSLNIFLYSILIFFINDNFIQN